MRNINNIKEIAFEERDTEIFRIPNTKTRLSTLQNYFFPRLEKLLHYTLSLTAHVYNVNPYERMTFVYCPSHRENAKENRDQGVVHIGVTAQKSSMPLKIFKSDGKPFVLHPTYLTFKVTPRGTMYVELLPFRQLVDNDYVMRISSLIERYTSTLIPLLSLAHISHTSDNSCCSFLPLHHAISSEEIGYLGIKLVSPKYYFPVDSQRGLNELILAFIILYALTESFMRVGEGEEPKLGEMLEQFKEWYVALKTTEGSILEEKLNNDEEKKDFEFSDLSELDSYSFVRAGKGLARK